MLRPAMRSAWWPTARKGFRLWNRLLRLVPKCMCRCEILPWTCENVRDESKTVRVHILSYYVTIITYVLTGALCFPQTIHIPGIMWCKSWRVFVSKHTSTSMCQKHCGYIVIEIVLFMFTSPWYSHTSFVRLLFTQRFKLPIQTLRFQILELKWAMDFGPLLCDPLLIPSG
jgi:hypothetical protein